NQPTSTILFPVHSYHPQLLTHLDYLSRYNTILLARNYSIKPNLQGKILRFGRVLYLPLLRYSILLERIVGLVMLGIRENLLPSLIYDVSLVEINCSNI